MKMENRNFSVSVTSCPKCGATCLTGHDDDGQVYCAKCLNSFSPKEIKHLDEKEYRQMIEKSKKTHAVGGWIAYTID